MRLNLKQRSLRPRVESVLSKASTTTVRATPSIDLLEARALFSVSLATLIGPTIQPGSSFTVELGGVLGGDATATVIGNNQTFQGSTGLTSIATRSSYGDSTAYESITSAGLVENGISSNSSLGNIVYTPPQVVLPPEMTAGQTYDASWSETDDSGEAPQPNSETLMLVSETPSPVTVPAGTFNAYQIDYSMTSNGSTQYQVQYWAPQVGQIEIEDSADSTYASLTASSELISYTLGDHLAFATQPSNAQVNTSLTPPVSVQLLNPDGSLDTSNSSSITLTVLTGPTNGTITGDATQPVDNGVATFANLKFSVPGQYILQASDGTVTPVQSDPFTVGDVDQLAFQTQPADNVAGHAGNPVVVAVDSSSGSPDTSDTSTIALSINGPAGYTPPTIASQTTSDGLANFTLPALTAAGTYTIIATETSNSLSPVTSQTFTITPADASKVVFTTSPTTAGLGQIDQAVVTVEDQYNNVVTTDTSTPTLSVTTGPSPAFAGGVPISQSNGTSTYDLTFSTAGVYTLQASDADLTPGASTAFTISTSVVTIPETKLAFAQQPTDAQAGAALSPAITVDVENANGQIVTTDDSMVTLSIVTNPGNAILNGTLTEKAVNGIATFSDLSISAAGNGYTLNASAGTLTPATSNAFNVSSGGTASSTTGLVPAALADTVPATVITGQPIKAANIRVKTTNTLAAIEKGFTVNVFASTTPLLNMTTAVPITTVKSKATLRTGKTATLAIPIKQLPATLPPGDYYLITQTVDANGNEPYLTSSATINVQKPVITLTATSSAVTPPTIAINHTGSTVLTLSNTGNISATGLMTITLQLSSDGVTPAADFTAVTTKAHINILPGKTSHYTLHFKIPKTFPAGTYTSLISATADNITVSIVGSTFTV